MLCRFTFLSVLLSRCANIKCRLRNSALVNPPGGHVYTCVHKKQSRIKEYIAWIETNPVGNIRPVKGETVRQPVSEGQNGQRWLCGGRGTGVETHVENAQIGLSLSQVLRRLFIISCSSIETEHLLLPSRQRVVDGGIAVE